MTLIERLRKVIKSRGHRGNGPPLSLSHKDEDEILTALEAAQELARVIERHRNVNNLNYHFPSSSIPAALTRFEEVMK
jgi:hypothetical protein